MSAIITEVGAVVTWVISTVEAYMDVITGEPLLLLFICLPLVGIGVGIIKRMIAL